MSVQTKMLPIFVDVHYFHIIRIEYCGINADVCVGSVLYNRTANECAISLVSSN